MLRYTLTLVLAFVSLSWINPAFADCSAFSADLNIANPCATAKPVQDGDSSKIHFNGHVSTSIFSTTANKVPFPKVELGGGAYYRLSEKFDIYSSARFTDDDVGKNSEITSMFLGYEDSFGDFGIESKLGRIRNCYCLYNYNRFNPTARGGVILPQTVYWHVLDELAGFSDGASVNVRHSPTGLTLSASETKTTISNSKMVNEHLFIPGDIKTGGTSKYGIQWQNYGFFTGYQHILWNLESSLTGKEQVKVDNWHIGYVNQYFEASYEEIILGTTLGKRMGLPKADGNSWTIKGYLNPEWSIRFNTNTVDYNTDVVNMFNPYKRKTVDNNIGAQYRSIGSNWTFRGEYHQLDGTSWINLQDNKHGIKKKWDLIALQAVYEF